MSIIGGYQSDLNLQDVNFVGDFPVEHTIGGYGETTGAANNYLIKLNPSITGYRKGLSLQVKFHAANTGGATINVDGNGARSLLKSSDGQLTSLQAGDIMVGAVYILIYNGTGFQVVAGLALNTGREFLYKSHATFGVPVGAGTKEVVLDIPYTLKAGELKGKEGIKIRANGLFKAGNNKTLRLYLGNNLLISNTIAPAAAGDFTLEAEMYRLTTKIVKGWAALHIHNRASEVKSIQTSSLNIDIVDTLIRLTGQSSVEQPSSVNTFSFIIEKIK